MVLGQNVCVFSDAASDDIFDDFDALFEDGVLRVDIDHVPDGDLVDLSDLELDLFSGVFVSRLAD